MKKLIKTHRLAFFILCANIMFLSCNKVKREKVFIQRKDTTVIELSVEIAQTDEERMRGFMERKNIPYGTGMLFLFPKDIHLSFWMKNTPSALSIAYIDSKGVIREIHELTPFSLNPVVASFSGRYALEVPQGWFKENNVQIGSTLRREK